MPVMRETHRGFTLVELMITIAVLAVLATLAGPNMVRFLNRLAISGACSELVDSLSLARLEGIQRSATSSNLVMIGPLCSKQNYGKGWAVYIKTTTTNADCFDDADTLIQRSDLPKRSVSIVSNLKDELGKTVNYIGFNGQGLPRIASGAVFGTESTFTCSIENSLASPYEITISALGRASLKEIVPKK